MNIDTYRVAANITEYRIDIDIIFIIILYIKIIHIAPLLGVVGEVIGSMLDPKTLKFYLLLMEAPQLLHKTGHIAF